VSATSAGRKTRQGDEGRQGEYANREVSPWRVRQFFPSTRAKRTRERQIILLDSLQEPFGAYCLSLIIVHSYTSPVKSSLPHLPSSVEIDRLFSKTIKS
jgi:hypothetical protein